jgi:hypothetical protein
MGAKAAKNIEKAGFVSWTAFALNSVSGFQRSWKKREDLEFKPYFHIII